MRSEEIEELALELEADELEGEDGQPLLAADIAPVLEALWERGLDLSVLGEVKDDGEEAEEEAALQGEVAI